MQRFMRFPHLVTLLMALSAIGGWLFLLSTISLSTITRGGISLLRPSWGDLTLATFAMLGGLALLSIFIASVLDEVMGGEAH
ncbi:MAG: hypothetical protein HYU86_12315 [Chloroflexi bacterium]|nr:hypothetical protein [Chloroflexota bacterium]